MMKGRELYEEAIRKSTRWNHGRTPDSGIQLIFVYNELKDKIVLNKADEIQSNMEDYTGRMGKENARAIKV